MLFFRHAALRPAGPAICLLLALTLVARAGELESSFTNALAQATLAEKSGQIQTALEIYDRAEKTEASHSANLCILTRHYCDLLHVANSTDLKKELAQHALACALQAVKADPQNATAHICVAVCYAKNFPYADRQTAVVYSRLIKLESEKAIALDPHQDVAFYLLGRWHYGVAHMSLLARALVQVVYGGLPHASNAEAIACFQKAIAIDPNRIINHAGLAQAYAAAGQIAQARWEWAKCQLLKPLDPDDADARQDAIKALNHLSP